MELKNIKADETVDVSGLQCPLLGMTPARLLKDMEPGQIIAVTSTDPGARNVMPVMAQMTGNELMGVHDEEDGSYRVYVRKA